MTTKNKKPDRFAYRLYTLATKYNLQGDAGTYIALERWARAEFRQGQKRMRTRACGIACSPEISHMKPAQRAGAVFVLPIEKE